MPESSRGQILRIGVIVVGIALLVFIFFARPQGPGESEGVDEVGASLSMAPSMPSSSITPSTPTAEPSKSPRKPKPAKRVSEEDVKTFLAAFTNFNWQESREVITARLEKAGAVPGSNASLGFYGQDFGSCRLTYCSMSNMRIGDIVLGGKDMAGDEAVLVNMSATLTENGQDRDLSFLCTLTPSRGGDGPTGGVFVEAACLGEGG